MIQILRDWRYMAPLGALAAITLIAAAIARSPHHHAAALAIAQPTSEATASPVPVRTPSLDEILLDARRKFDLAALRDALESYHSRLGAYPSTAAAFQGVCATPGEALCGLAWVAAKVPSSDGQTQYRYRSDGASYTLYAAIATPDGSGACPDEVPPELAGRDVFCLSSKGAAP